AKPPAANDFRRHHPPHPRQCESAGANGALISEPPRTPSIFARHLFAHQELAAQEFANLVRFLPDAVAVRRCAAARRGRTCLGAAWAAQYVWLFSQYRNARAQSLRSGTAARRKRLSAG